MGVTVEQIQRQVEAVIKALKKMSAKEREQRPYKEFGENYNRLLELSKEIMISVDSRRWPPEIEIKSAAMGPTHINARYVEVHSYLEQLLSILAEEGDYPIGVVRG